MVKINQNLHRLQVAWRDAQQSSSPAADNLREQFERLMTIYLSTKTAMTEPQMLQNCLNLQVSMAVLLVQLAIGNEGSQPIELTFPLPDGYSSLAYVPGKQALPWELPIYSHLSLYLWHVKSSISLRFLAPGLIFQSNQEPVSHTVGMLSMKNVGITFSSPSCTWLALPQWPAQRPHSKSDK